MIRVHFGNAEASLTPDELFSYCNKLALNRYFTPFDPQVLEFCADLSRALLRSPLGAKFPQIISLGYWLRPAAVKKLATEYGPKEELLRVPRGLAFHLPPANVDTIFIYSWLLSVLSGNANVVRVPNDMNVVAKHLIETIAKLSPIGITKSNLFISYQRNNEITQGISNCCDVRLVWGGDAKAREIRKLALPPNATDLNFANRFSLCLLNAEMISSLESKEVKALAEKFYNDAYWFDQMGCSSPRVIFWYKGTLFNSVKYTFFEALRSVIRSKGYAVDVGVASGRHNYNFSSILDYGVNSVDNFGENLSVLSSSNLDGIKENIQGGGVFFSKDIEELSELSDFVSRIDQTMSYFGFSKPDLYNLAQNLNGRGIDRIVPVGNALDFGKVWDGWDLPNQLTRLVKVS